MTTSSFRFPFASSPRPSLYKDEDWGRWGWQLSHALKTKEDYQTFFKLTAEEKEAFEKSQGLFRIQTTPYYASLADPEVPEDPIRLMLMPRMGELQNGGQQMLDPLGEERHAVNERLIHRYPDRVLFLVTDMCSVYCRYCTRKRFTGNLKSFVRSDAYLEALEYLKKNKGIREVILSGGDPLTLSDSRLEKVFEDLRSIDHIEIIRLGTRMPVVCPMRITEELLSMMKRFHPIFVMTHFNHPQEISLEAARALTRMVDQGFPVMNQMVLLNGINNHEAIVQALSRRLLSLRVKPYYMFHCDPSKGTEHFQTSIEDSLKIQKNLWGRFSGLGMPHLSLDIPGGGGKVGLVPDFEKERHETHSVFKGWDGFEAPYINPEASEIKTPSTLSAYLSEWDLLKNQSYGNKDLKPAPAARTSPRTSETIDPETPR